VKNIKQCCPSAAGDKLTMLPIRHTELTVTQLLLCIVILTEENYEDLVCYPCLEYNNFCNLKIIMPPTV